MSLAGLAGWGTLVFFALARVSSAAEVVPTDVQLPGTQPGETSQIESVSKCDNCHGNFDPGGEPWFNWSGSMMAHASRDPIFWATVAIAEQDFDGVGDLCIRCHVPEGWLGGRSTPTDGSGLAEGDDDGLQCDVCHRLTRPDGSEHVGVQNAPFLAHDGGSPPTGFLGSGMYVIWDENSKLGPYADAEARHQFEASQFHRSEDLCGTCHDVSNPVVGDLAHNHGAQTPLAPGSFSGIPGAPVEDKAAFNNFPYQYGVVERTTSEHKASAWDTTPVSDYPTLPAELQGGSIQLAYQAALLAGNGGDYEDGTTRTFSCQSCHMRPTVGEGCDKNPPVRGDLPVHDLTGGNYWMPEVIQYLDGLGQLVLGGGLTQDQRNALDAGALRAQQNLDHAASLSVSGNQVTVTNLTGHRLITGYPEGRRMWLRIRWYDAQDTLLADDGAYGALSVDIGGAPAQVETLLDLDPPYTRIYEVHGAMTQEWASQLRGLGWPADLPLGFDRETGLVDGTLEELASEPPGSHHETFHFALNNYVAKDTRIPPWGMAYSEAVARNLLPVPSDQYGGGPGGAAPPGGVFDHQDVVTLNPPPGANHAAITLLYQPTSWEYVQFLELANTGEIAPLAAEGAKLRDAWQNTQMAAPYTMVSASWQLTVPACQDGVDNDGDGFADWDGAGVTAQDPGCSGPADESENDASTACDDRLDNDGYGWAVFPRDPGCRRATSTSESPQCQDGLNNDPAQDAFVDFDGGASAGLPAAQQTAPDPQCNGIAWKDREARPRPRCGFGYEVAPLLVALVVWSRIRRRSQAA
jgi:cytochrome c553